MLLACGVSLDSSFAMSAFSDLFVVLILINQQFLCRAVVPLCCNVFSVCYQLDYSLVGGVTLGVAHLFRALHFPAQRDAWWFLGGAALVH